jgi:hypothetical protein
MAKISKTDAGYGPGQPHCGVCVHFVEGDSEDDENDACELVMGKIDEDKLCKLFTWPRLPTLAESGGE